ncbi:BTAD domain-containing putative transcriptional regulator [Rothia sp. ARF10]|nr:BTAD domain-containing putative transcriptional regulator [Rothia sp. ARF10]
MRIALLGSLQVDEGRTALSPRDRVVLLALASRPGVELSTETLAETLWGEDLPDSWQKVVQGCISRLRKALGPEAVETTAHGYRLVLHRDDLDHLQFENLLTRARRLLSDGEPERALFLTRQARELWRGEPFAELAEWGPGRVESERLVELSRDGEELHVEAALRAGHHRDVVGEASRLVAEQPMRERRWGLLALAQYLDGRQGDALQTLHRARQTLVGELGLDPGPELAELEQSILRQDPSLAAAPESGGGAGSDCPYLGLLPYDIGDAAAFFGRGGDVSACLRRLDETGVVAILGPSGSGKSSLARAGVAAALERDGRHVHVMTPGTHPADSLTALHPKPQDVLVVDQCEEALALPADSSQRTEFVAALVAFAATGRGLLVVSMRADRLGELSSHPELARLVEAGLYLLGPMSEEDLRQAIEGPAGQAGLRLEPGLVNLLLREVSGEPAALPLLSHVLRQTWFHREGSTLTVEGYAATGGVREAVSQSAEGLFRDLDPARQAIVRELMLRLVSPDEGGDPVRTRVPRRTVMGDAAHSELVEQLVTARLLASDGDTIEIAHESLALAWPRLRSWLDEDVDGLRIMRHVAVAAQSWDELGRPDSELYRGVRQARAAEWLGRSSPTLTREERDFLAASADLADREQQATEEQVRRERRLNNRLRLGLAGTAAALAVAILLGTVAKANGDRADREATSASRQALAADARRLGAEALRSEDLDQSLLLAAAGVSFDDSVETRNYLLETLGRGTALAAATRREAPIFGMAVEPRDGTIATSFIDADIDILDGMTLTSAKPPGQGTRAVGIVASPAGGRFAAAGWTNLVQDRKIPAVVLLDADGARSAVQLGGIPVGFHTFQEMAFSPGGRWFSTTLRPFDGNDQWRTLVWDLTSPGRPVADLALEVGAKPLVSPDGRLLYAKDDGSLQVTDLPSGTTRRVVSAEELGVRTFGEVLVASPDGRLLALAAGDETVVLDRASLTPKWYLPGAGWTTGVAFSPDGRRVAATGDRLIVWDITGDEPKELLFQESPTEWPQFSPDGGTVYATSGGLIQAWDVTGERRFVRVSPGSETWDASIPRWTPALDKVGYGFMGPSFRVHDVASGRLGAEVVVTDMEQRNMFDFAWHPNGSVLNITTGDPVVRIWDARTGKELARHTLDPANSEEGAAFGWFTGDGERLLVSTTTGRLHVLDARSLAPVREPILVNEPVDGEPRDVEGFALSTDGLTVFTRDRIVDLVTGRVRAYPDLGVAFDDVFPSPDGRRLFVDAKDDGSGLLDLTSMTWIARPSPASARMIGYQSVFSDDGTLFASIADDGRVHVWDGVTGALRASMPMDVSGAPAFSKDKKKLLVADQNGSLLTWNLDPASWVATACRLAGRDLTQVEWSTYLPERPYRRVCST